MKRALSYDRQRGFDLDLVNYWRIDVYGSLSYVVGQCRKLLLPFARGPYL